MNTARYTAAIAAMVMGGCAADASDEGSEGGIHVRCEAHADEVGSFYYERRMRSDDDSDEPMVAVLCSYIEPRDGTGTGGAIEYEPGSDGAEIGACEMPARDSVAPGEYYENRWYCRGATDDDNDSGSDGANDDCESVYREGVTITLDGGVPMMLIGKVPSLLSWECGEGVTFKAPDNFHVGGS